MLEFVFIEVSSANGQIRFHVRRLEDETIQTLSSHDTPEEAKQVADALNAEMSPAGSTSGC
jgi:hypothetical protein